MKLGDVNLGDEYFDPKNQKHRITTFVDGDILDWLKSEAAKVNMGYQTFMNLQLRNLMTAGSDALYAQLKPLITRVMEELDLRPKEKRVATIGKLGRKQAKEMGPLMRHATKKSASKRAR
jgi:hypothetical protein